MNIFINGIGGFLGLELARVLLKSGHELKGASHDPTRIPFPIPIEQGKLGKPLEPQALSKVEMMIHCVYVREAGLERNFEDTKMAFQAGVQAGVKHQIYISSYSARSDSFSEYGQLKFKSEQLFLEVGQTVIRPGLVIGPGGLFARNTRQIQKFPIVPLIGGGRDVLPIIGLEDFLRAMMTILETKEKGAVNLFNPHLITLKELLELIQNRIQRRIWMPAIPLGFAEKVLTIMNRLRIKLPIDVDNIKALKANQSPIHVSDLSQFISNVQLPEESVSEALLNM